MESGRIPFFNVPFVEVPVRGLVAVAGPVWFAGVPKEAWWQRKETEPEEAVFPTTDSLVCGGSIPIAPLFPAAIPLSISQSRDFRLDMRNL